MKKTVFILFAAALTFAGCNKSVEVGTGETVSASFQISTEMTTKATLDGDGQGVKVNRFIMEVWHVTGSGASQVSELYTRQVKYGTQITAGTNNSILLQNAAQLFYIHMFFTTPVLFHHQ